MQFVGEEVNEAFPLDKEWIQLMLMARNLGLKPEDVRSFLISCNSRFDIQK